MRVAGLRSLHLPRGVDLALQTFRIDHVGMLERGGVDEHGLAVLGRVLGTQHAERRRIASRVSLSPK